MWVQFLKCYHLASRLLYSWSCVSWYQQLHSSALCIHTRISYMHKHIQTPPCIYVFFHAIKQSYRFRTPHADRTFVSQMDCCLELPWALNPMHPQQSSGPLENCVTRLSDYPITRLPDGVWWPCVWWLVAVVGVTVIYWVFVLKCVLCSIQSVFHFDGEPPGSVREERSQVFVNLNPRSSILKRSDSLPSWAWIPSPLLLLQR